ncbi:hypothetical protein ACI79D_21230 [Geodermatophilus sp. SYSU D00708]
MGGQQATLGTLGTWAVVLGAVLTSSVISAVLTKVMDRTGAHVDRVREGYAEASKALVAWSLFPDRIQRRVDDEPDTRAALAKTGTDITERLAYYSGWVHTESPVLGELYMSLAETLRRETAPRAQSAWKLPPRRSGDKMNLGTGVVDASPAGWRHVRAFAAGFQYRFGWRRYLVPPALLRRRLIAKGLLHESSMTTAAEDVPETPAHTGVATEG